METIFPTEPCSNSELMRRSLVLYGISLPHVLVLTLLFGIIVFLPRFISDFIGQDLFYTVAPLDPNRLWLLVINFVTLILFIGILWNVYCAALNRYEPLVEDFSVGLRKVFAIFIYSFFIGAILMGLTLLIFGIQVALHHHNLLFNGKYSGLIMILIAFGGQLLLMLYVSALFIFVVPLIAIEDLSIFKAMERSVALVWRHWWRTFSLQVTPWIIYVFVLLIIKYILAINIHLYYFGNAPHGLWSTILNLIIFVLFVPWFAALLLIQLKDLELRRDRANTT